MKTFKDSAGRDWKVVIDTNAIKRARDTAGVDLVAIADGDLYGRLHLDPVLVCDVAWGVCLPEAESRKFSREDFNTVLVGDAIAGARTAILEDLVDFFPNPLRESLKKALARATETPETPGGPSGTSPASAASTPAP
jgi:hypothetical protein